MASVVPAAGPVLDPRPARAAAAGAAPPALICAPTPTNAIALGTMRAPSTQVARIWDGRSAMAVEYSARNRAVTGAGANMARLVSGMVSQPKSGEMV